MKRFPELIRFEWDEANQDKNWIKHRVSRQECEEVFFDPHKRMVKEPRDSGGEVRLILLGRTQAGRALFLVFTMRRRKIRVISARDLNQKEKSLL